MSIAEDIQTEAALRQMLGEVQSRLKKETAKVNSTAQIWDPSKDQAKFADAQMRCDVVAGAFGKQAPRPMMGEDLVDYKIRLATSYKMHAKDENVRKVDLSQLAAHPEALENFVDTIYNDAMEYARSPASVPQQTLREIKKRDPSGREYSEFQGDPAVWLSHFSGPLLKVRGWAHENIAAEALRRLAGVPGGVPAE